MNFHVEEMAQVYRFDLAWIERTEMRGLLCTWLAGLAESQILAKVLPSCIMYKECSVHTDIDNCGEMRRFISMHSIL